MEVALYVTIDTYEEDIYYIKLSAVFPTLSQFSILGSLFSIFHSWKLNLRPNHPLDTF